MNASLQRAVGINKWIFRQNARIKMEFGIHTPVWNGDKGVSELRHYAVHNPAAARAMVRDAIECLQLMRAPKFREALERRREAFQEHLRGAA